MSRIATITLTGACGESYEFGVYPLDSEFPPLGAVYYISEGTMTDYEMGACASLCVGKGGDLSRCLEDPDQEYGFTANGANSIGLHLDPNKQSRLEKGRDLLNALQPPCID